MATVCRLITLTCALAAAQIAQAALLTVTGSGDSVAVDGLVTLREAMTSISGGANVNADVVAVAAALDPACSETPSDALVATKAVAPSQSMAAIAGFGVPSRLD